MASTDWKKVGSDSAKKGNSVQRDAIPKLECHFAMVERIESGFRVFRIKGRMVATPADKVSGDFRAMIPPTGRSVLIECKWRSKDRLQWSDLEKHQHEALVNHRGFGGLSLILWVTKHGFYLFDPQAHPEYAPKHSLTIDMTDKSLFSLSSMRGWI